MKTEICQTLIAFGIICGCAILLKFVSFESDRAVPSASEKPLKGLDAEIVSFNGHTYVRAKYRTSPEIPFALVHDPDCDCSKKPALETEGK